MAQETTTPPVPVAAAPKQGAAVLLRYGNDMLLMLRDDKPGLPSALQWSVFAGGIEEGETAEITIGRELREELGGQVQVERLGKTPANTWFTASITGQHAANLKRGEGCGHGFFSFDALVWMSKIDGKLGLGGAIKKFMERAPEEIRIFLQSGRNPNLSVLTGIIVEP
ncbi:NUDIX domain-containing protein [Candidatus Parcubacteria bacterium]|nr:NUDIX domain-containing protein [Candidatus Parcubacteria bacterium]